MVGHQKCRFKRDRVQSTPGWQSKWDVCPERDLRADRIRHEEAIDRAVYLVCLVALSFSYH